MSGSALLFTWPCNALSTDLASSGSGRMSATRKQSNRVAAPQAGMVTLPYRRQTVDVVCAVVFAGLVWGAIRNVQNGAAGCGQGCVALKGGATTSR